MKLERKNIKFPLWRKKVDSSLLDDSVTPIPQWLWPIWNIEDLFSTCTSSKDSDGKIKILFNNKVFSGNIFKTKIRRNKGNDLYRYRLKFEKKVSDLFKDIFLMSYMRSIEEKLRKGKPEYTQTLIEEEIPFWEFIDIEFDSKNKTAYLNAHYTQKPQYFELFKELVKSHILKSIENVILSKEGLTIVKGIWKDKTKLDDEIDAKNVIYNLIDTKNKLIYIGETESLKNRLSQFRNEIPNWDYYRFDSLPNDLTKQQRVAIERLIIRIMASFLSNDKGIHTMNISEYALANRKIDT